MPGHWEGDLLFGSKNSQIATLVERQSRYVMLARIDGKDTPTVVNPLIKHAQKHSPAVNGQPSESWPNACKLSSMASFR